MIKKLICLSLCLLMPLGARAQMNRYTASFLDLFDTVTMVVGCAPSAGDFKALAQQIHDELEIYHHLYDIYNDYPGINNLKTINDMAGIAPVKVEPPIIDLLLFCQDMHRKTGGLVDITMGNMLSLWHEARTHGIDFPEEARLPDETALTQAAVHAGFEHIIIDRQESTVFITHPHVRLDVGAIGKGFAVEMVCRNLPQGLLVSVGGNIRSTGVNPLTGQSWTAGVQDPEGSMNDYLHILRVDGVSVVTSGDYQRYYTVDGVRYGHIIDPRTQYPPRLWKAVCILAPDSAAADALSTALYVLPMEEGQQLLDLFGAHAMWIDRQGNQLYSPGFTHYLKA